MTELTTRKTTLTARLDERFAAPLRNAAFARRTWFTVTLAAILALHLALLALMLWRDRDDPIQLAKVDETPVEVIVEQPKAPPPPTPPAPKTPAAKPLVEKPATSAPRAQNDEKLEKDADDKETHAPKSEAPKEVPKAAAAPTPAPVPPEVEAKAEPKAEPETKDAAEPPKPDVLEKDAEALDKLPPEPPKKPAEFAKAKPPPPKPRPPKTAVDQLAGSSDLPDYTFAKPMRKKARITGGTEDDRYLAVVFGMITQYHRPIMAPAGEWFVAVAFQVDAHGNLVGLGVQHSSGYRSVDLAAMEAVQRAAPFPPPPTGTTTGLVARLHSSSRAAMAGEQ